LSTSQIFLSKNQNLGQTLKLKLEIFGAKIQFLIGRAFQLRAAVS